MPAKKMTTVIAGMARSYKASRRSPGIADTMSDTPTHLRRKINSAYDLKSVVRTMKAVAASSIGQYEKSVRALTDYYRTVELGLGACFRQNGSTRVFSEQKKPEIRQIRAIVFGSDQGLVGQFNEKVADFAVKKLEEKSKSPRVWAVGERVRASLTESGLPPVTTFGVPNSVKAITLTVGQMIVENEKYSNPDDAMELHLFYNRPTSDAFYTPVCQQLLPLDENWRRKLSENPWPTKNPPEILLSGTATLMALIREYLFVSLFRACAESLASENASRLFAMQRADKNIEELLESLKGSFHRLRQSGIDEELFDVISGFKALSEEET